ncbi:MAG: adenylosuccinate synthase [Oligoflexales bacterium]|nr:adenylosuccinate synthase [Oligoflexales bacterium]
MVGQKINFKSPIQILVGAQWGDEGKGKWVDCLGKKSEYIVRFQGGNNAGHTIYVEGKKYVLHQIPSGILSQTQICVLSAGVVVNPVALSEEIKGIKADFVVTPERLWLSARAHVITPWHVWLDCQSESQAATFIGTTKRGIGPTYADKAARSGIRLVDYIDSDSRKSWIDQMQKTHPEFKRSFSELAEEWKKFEAAADIIAPYVTDVETKLRKQILKGSPTLLEGAQGTLLDLNYGTYPFVTSSSTIAGGAVASLGIPPKSVGEVIGIAKAYITRVGEGPMPTEMKDGIGQEIASRGKEFGASTGRPRRVGWFDAVAMRYAHAINGFDYVILNKMDILENISELKICTSYQHPKLGLIEDFPDDADILAQCVPNYQTFPGFGPIPRQGSINDLPSNAKNFVAAIEKLSGVKVGIIGTGVGREDALYGI